MRCSQELIEGPDRVSRLVKRADTKREVKRRAKHVLRDMLKQNQIGEFDPGSERTLAACLTHASRTRKGPSGPEYSGARVSNAWVIFLMVWDNTSKEVLIPDKTTSCSRDAVKGGLSMEAIANR